MAAAGGLTGAMPALATPTGDLDLPSTTAPVGLAEDLLIQMVAELYQLPTKDLRDDVQVFNSMSNDDTFLPSCLSKAYESFLIACNTNPATFQHTDRHLAKVSSGIAVPKKLQRDGTPEAVASWVNDKALGLNLTLDNTSCNGTIRKFAQDCAPFFVSAMESSMIPVYQALFVRAVRRGQVRYDDAAFRAQTEFVEAQRRQRELDAHKAAARTVRDAEAAQREQDMATQGPERLIAQEVAKQLQSMMTKLNLPTQRQPDASKRQKKQQSQAPKGQQGKQGHPPQQPQQQQQQQQRQVQRVQQPQQQRQVREVTVQHGQQPNTPQRRKGTAAKGGMGKGHGKASQPPPGPPHHSTGSPAPQRTYAEVLSPELSTAGKQGAARRAKKKARQKVAAAAAPVAGTDPAHTGTAPSQVQAHNVAATASTRASTGSAIPAPTQHTPATPPHPSVAGATTATPAQTDEATTEDPTAISVVAPRSATAPIPNTVMTTTPAADARLTLRAPTPRTPSTTQALTRQVSPMVAFTPTAPVAQATVVPGNARAPRPSRHKRGLGRGAPA